MNMLSWCNLKGFIYYIYHIAMKVFIYLRSLGVYKNYNDTIIIALLCFSSAGTFCRVNRYARFFIVTYVTTFRLSQ